MEANITNATNISAELDGVVKRRDAALALDGISLALRPGEVTALLGPNGAGKSTAVGLLIGRLAPDRGQARLFGGDPRDPAARKRLGVLLQQAGAQRGLRVAELIDLFRGYYPDPRPRAEVVALAGLGGLERRPCSALSGGQQRRLQFALALCGRPDLLVLDEPTTAMDGEARRSLWTTVRAEAARGAAVLLTTHYLEEAEALADRVVVIDRGRIVADAPPEAIKTGVGASAIRCRSHLPDAALAALPAVSSIGREGGRIVLLTAAPADTLRALLAADRRVQDLSVSTASLEDALARLVADEDHAFDLESAA
jgi:ABC-2 type transport system ATP-binding protein